MDNDINSNPPRKERKKRGEPRLDFNDPYIQDWLFVINHYFPELVAPERFICEMKKRLRSITGLNPNEKQYLIDHLNPAPDPPDTKGIKKFEYLEWETWLAYYALCQKAGKFITPETIAKMTGHDVETVKSKFKAAKKRIYDYPDFISEMKEEIESKTPKD